MIRYQQVVVEDATGYYKDVLEMNYCIDIEADSEVVVVYVKTKEEVDPMIDKIIEYIRQNKKEEK